MMARPERPPRKDQWVEGWGYVFSVQELQEIAEGVLKTLSPKEQFAVVAYIINNSINLNSPETLTTASETYRQILNHFDPKNTNEGELQTAFLMAVRNEALYALHKMWRETQ